MTNKSINLIMGLKGKTASEKSVILKEILAIEFKKIKAQAKLFCEKSDYDNELVNGVIRAGNCEELFEYLKKLSVIEITLLDAYGIDVSVMNLLKVSD